MVHKKRKIFKSSRNIVLKEYLTRFIEINYIDRLVRKNDDNINAHIQQVSYDNCR